MPTFDFSFDPRYRLAAAPFGVTPRNARLDVDDQALDIRFGPWRLSTPLDNVSGCEETGPFSFVKTAGPAHLSFADRGLTLATNGREGLCIRFAAPVPAIDPWGRIRHPGVTVTVERINVLRELLESQSGA